MHVSRLYTLDPITWRSKRTEIVGCPSCTLYYCDKSHTPLPFKVDHLSVLDVSVVVSVRNSNKLR